MILAQLPTTFGSRVHNGPDSLSPRVRFMSATNRVVTCEVDDGAIESVSATNNILERVARQEDGSVDEMIDRFGNLVWSIVRKFCFNPSEAEDAAQEIFVELWKSAHRYSPDVASESTFVGMIARRRMIDRVRRQGRQVPTSSAEQQEPTDHSTPTATRYEVTDEADATSKAFEKLRPEQQEVLQLAIHHGRSHEQIAASTGLPLGTVKTHARRGLMRLRELLNGSDHQSDSNRVMGGSL
jgi:RNA polymerase sigma factor (sigma-70 family)